jgi:hypothetical protein
MSAGLKQAHWKVVEHRKPKMNQRFGSTQMQMHSDHFLAPLCAQGSEADAKLF